MAQSTLLCPDCLANIDLPGLPIALCANCLGNNLTISKLQEATKLTSSEYDNPQSSTKGGGEKEIAEGVLVDLGVNPRMASITSSNGSKTETADLRKESGAAKESGVRKQTDSLSFVAKDGTDEYEKFMALKTILNNAKLSMYNQLQQNQIISAANEAKAIFDHYRRTQEKWTGGKQDKTMKKRDKYYDAVTRLRNFTENYSSLGRFIEKEQRKDITRNEDKRIYYRRVKFLAVLSQDVKDIMRDMLNPVVCLYCRQYDDFNSPWATLTENADGVWSCELTNIPQNWTHLEYVYAVKEEKAAADDEVTWEYLEKSQENPDGCRFLYTAGLTDSLHVSDGIVLTERDIITAATDYIAGTNAEYKAKQEQERNRGYRAMLPDWAAEIQAGISIEDIVDNIVRATERQYDWSHGLTTRKNSDDRKEEVLKILDDYIMDSLSKIETFFCSQDDSSSPSLACVSLLGLLYLSYFFFNEKGRYPSISTIASYGQLTMAKVGEKLTEKKDQHLNIMGPALTTSKIFVLSVAKALIWTIRGLSQDGLQWCFLMPLYHIVMGIGTDELEGYDYKATKWWGVEEIEEHIKMHYEKNKMGLERTHEVWLGWLKPFFGVSDILPRTYIALLSVELFIDFLKQPTPHEEVIPLNSVLAYAFKPPVMDIEEGKLDLYKALLTYIQRWKEYAGSNSPDEETFKIMGNLVDSFLEPDLNSCCDGFEFAVQVYLCLMDAAVTSSESATNSGDGLYFSFLFMENKLSRDSEGIVSTGQLLDKEIEQWKLLFSCETRNDHVHEWWKSKCLVLFKLRLAEVAQINPWFPIHMYCSENHSQLPLMERIVADSAINNAKYFLTMKGEDLPNNIDSHKLGELIDHAVSSIWAEVDENQMSLVRNMINWENFLPVWKLYSDYLGEDVYVIGEENKRRLESCKSSLEYVIDSLKERSMNLIDFKLLSDDSSRFCDVVDVLCGSSCVEYVRQLLEECRKEQEEFRRLRDDLLTLWEHAKDKVEDSLQEALNDWLLRSTDTLLLRDMFIEGPVQCDVIPLVVRHIVEPFSKLAKRKVFCKMFEDLQTVNKCTWDELANAFHQSQMDYESLRMQLLEGSISLADLDRITEQAVGGSTKEFLTEMLMMTSGNGMEDSEICQKRCEQYWRSVELKNYYEEATLCLKLRTDYQLNGDFTVIEKIIELKDRKLKLNEMTKSFEKQTNMVSLDEHKRESLQAFVECKEFVMWAREKVPKRDINNFVDLASKAFGVDPMAAIRTDDLRSALDGYAPLIYGLCEDPDSLGYSELLDLCQLVWRTLETTPSLPGNLRRSASYTDFLSKVEQLFGNVEMLPL